MSPHIEVIHDDVRRRTCHSSPHPTALRSWRTGASRGWCLLMLGGDLSVGSIGYGAMQLTGPKVWGDYPDHDGGVALLRAVVAEGVTFIDTADVYGPHSNEELIREALHPYPDNLVIATKGGFVRGGPEYSDLGAVGARLYLRQA